MLAGFVAVMLFVGRSELGRSLTATGVALSAVSAALGVLALGSLYEWLVHRLVYHAPSRVRLLNSIHFIHERGHHWHRFPPDRYVDSGPVERIPVSPPDPFGLCHTRARRFLAWLGQYSLYMAIGVPFAFVPAWLVTHNPVFTGAAVLSGVVVSYFFIRVHDVVHYPKQRSIERMRWFQFLDQHHYIHHIDQHANINLLLPLCDWLFGTLRLELTDDELCEWPSFEVAKFVPAAASKREPRSARRSA